VEGRKRDREPTNVVHQFKEPVGEEVCTELCTGEARRGIVWWRKGDWRRKGVRGTVYMGFAPYVTEKNTEGTY
jgi:hypothetical protein